MMRNGRTEGFIMSVVDRRCNPQPLKENHVQNGLSIDIVEEQPSNQENRVDLNSLMVDLARIKSLKLLF
jgi:hypothetical protein